MTGFVASSAERYSGPLAIEIAIDAADAAAFALVEQRLRVFLRAVTAGYFFPGASTGLPEVAVAGAGNVLSARLEVAELPITAVDVLGGLLLDCVYQQVFSIHSARVFVGQERDLLIERQRRPAACGPTRFIVDLPADADLGNNTLLIEIEFAEPIPAEIGEGLLEDLALMEGLWLAYPVIDEDEEVEPVESLGAQRHFNDPRTIHHHEWAWNADPASWNLLVNLCCAWSRRLPVVRLHIE